MQKLPHATVAVIVEQDGRFLLVQERDAGRIVYNQPAGHLDNGESLLQATVRETREETAWEVIPTALVGLYTYHAPQNGITYVRACFAATALRHHPDEPLDADILAATWKTLAEIRELEASGELRSPLVLRCIQDYLAGQRAPLELLHDL